MNELDVGRLSQTGVPIVPVLMHSDYSPRGWLGLLTAGTLWTPLHDKTSFAENIDGLVRQINLAVTGIQSDLEHSQLLSAVPDFSAKDLRSELDRLKDDQGHATSTPHPNDLGKASVPAHAPELPRGVLVTQSMKQLLSHLTIGDKSRIGFLVTRTSHEFSHCIFFCLPHSAYLSSRHAFP